MTNSEHLEQLIKRYHPRFGDPESIRIRDMYSKLTVARAAVIAADKKVRSSDRMKGKKTRAEQDVEMIEGSLIFVLEQELFCKHGIEKSYSCPPCGRKGLEYGKSLSPVSP